MKNELDLFGVGMTSQRTRDRLIDRLRDQGIADESLMQVMGSLPRHLFVDEALSHRAYEDKALPIGFGQTISQPFIVALMSSALFQGQRLGRVLEVGTGCGYQTAILSQFSDRVFTVERIKALQNRARDRLKELGLRNIQYRHSDGGMGWSELGPFDGIMVTASPREIPEELIQQLAPGGRMVIPIGNDDDQALQLVTLEAGEVKVEELERVKFVPMMSGKQ